MPWIVEEVAGAVCGDEMMREQKAGGKKMRENKWEGDEQPPLFLLLVAPAQRQRDLTSSQANADSFDTFIAQLGAKR